MRTRKFAFEIYWPLSKSNKSLRIPSYFLLCSTISQGGLDLHVRISTFDINYKVRSVRLESPISNVTSFGTIAVNKEVVFCVFIRLSGHNRAKSWNPKKLGFLEMLLKLSVVKVENSRILLWNCMWKCDFKKSFAFVNSQH